MRRTSNATMFVALTVMVSPSSGDDQSSYIAKGHNLLRDHSESADVGPGTPIGNLTFRDVDGQAVYLSDSLRNGPAVFVFLSTSCPLAKRYTTRLNRLKEAYAKHGLCLFAVFPNSDETPDGLRAFAESADYQFAVVCDESGYLTEQLGATMTPQVFLIDQDSVLRFRGAIDDNRYENRVRTHHLADAIDAVLAGTPVRVPTVQSMGCTIHRETVAGAGGVTYSGHIARILQDNCQSCHRNGEVAPFALTSYEDAVRWRTEIREYTTSRLMPPWKADSEFAHYRNDTSLTDREIELIAQWVEQGTPIGHKEEIPPTPRFTNGWAFGEPDIMVEMPEEFVVGPEGEDIYRHFVIPWEADRHRFVQALDVRPDNRSVVHHVIAYIDTSGKARELDAEDDGPGYSRFGGIGFEAASVIGGWAPGNLPIRTPEGTGRWLPDKCDIVLQVHYYRTGIEERDRTKIGIYFSDAPHPVPTRGGVAINKDFVVPAGEKAWEVTAEYTVEKPSYLFSVTPHMHLIGETMKVEAHCPDGTVIPVVRIDDWDFNWQSSYYFEELQHVPAGTVFRLTATFDNSRDNPNNPSSPPQDIGWGERTTDEMCIAFLGLLHEEEYDPVTKSRRTPPATVATDDSE